MARGQGFGLPVQRKRTGGSSKTVGARKGLMAAEGVTSGDFSCCRHPVPDPTQMVCPEQDFVRGNAAALLIQVAVGAAERCAPLRVDLKGEGSDES
jgi:hypothetical protein